MRLFCPFPSARNAATDWAEQHTLAWAERWGLLPTIAARKAFHVARFADLMGRAYPTTDPATLAVIVDWNSWTFLVDTQLDHHALGQDPQTLAAFATTVNDILGDEACPRDRWWPPLLKALANITDRLRARAHPGWMARFRASVADTLAMCVREAEYRRYAIMPTEAEYIQMRPHTSGSYCFLDLIEIANQIPMLDTIRHHPTIVRMRELTNESIYLANDLASLAKELQQGDGNNMVIIVQRDQQLSLEAAQRAVAHRHDRVVSLFLRQYSNLPADDAATNRHLVRYVRGLTTWMRANLDWSEHTGRYQVARDGELAREVNAM